MPAKSRKVFRTWRGKDTYVREIPHPRTERRQTGISARQQRKAQKARRRGATR